MIACWREVLEHDTPGVGAEYSLNTKIHLLLAILHHLYQVFVLCLRNECNIPNRLFLTYQSFLKNAYITYK